MISKAPQSAIEHVVALLGRCPKVEQEQLRNPAGPAVSRAALDYLASMVVEENVSVAHMAELHGVPAWRVLAAAGPLRTQLRYREYVGEWIRSGRPSQPMPRPETASAKLAGLVTPQMPRRSVHPLARPISVKPAKPPSVTMRMVGKVRGWADAISRPFRHDPGPVHIPNNSWTGTSGTVSYADKDQSPD